MKAFLFPGQGHKIPREYTMYIICKEMGWDYYTYFSQPSFFIEQIITIMEVEKNYQDIKSKNNE